MAFSAFDPLTFLTILLLTFALFLLITGAFTAYFGSGKSRKIGVGLLIGGLVVGLAWGWYSGPAAGSVELVPIIVKSFAASFPASFEPAAATGRFFLASMRTEAPHGPRTVESEGL